MMLLSRTAADLYWLGRHLERAESLARVVREHTRLLVDLPVTVDSDWTALLAITGAPAQGSATGRLADEEEITSLLVYDSEYPGSLVRTVEAARENLRLTRQIVPWTAWECLNRLHLAVDSDARRSRNRSSRLALCDVVIDACRHLAGILVTTMNRDEAFAFVDLGVRIERADMATRVLEVRAGGLIRSGSDPGLPAPDRSPYEDVRWLSVLRSLGGLQMYHRSVSGPVEGPAVLDFVAADPRFPRSIRHCVGAMERALAELPSADAPRQACQRVLVVVCDQPGQPIDPAALQRYLDRVQIGLGFVNDTLARVYFSNPRAPAPGGEMLSATAG